MYHQVEHHGDICAARRVRREAIALDEQRVGQMRPCGADSAIESLHMPHLQHDTGIRRSANERIRFVERDGNRFLDEQVLSGGEDLHPDLVMRHGGHHAADGVAARDQRIE